MSDYETLFDQALTLMESSDLLEAVGLWDQLLQDLSDLDLEERALLSLNKGVCLVELGHPGEAVALCASVLDEDDLDLGCDLGLQLVHLVMEQSRLTGDLGKARAYGEMVLTAMEQESANCSPEALLAIARQRAELARDMGQPDDAEETLATVLELLSAPLEESSGDPDFFAEIRLVKAQILETRAHNRFEGHADEIAALDLEDAVNIYLEVMGPDHEETRRVQELLLEVSGNY